MKLSLAGRPGSATPGLGPITKVPVVARNISWNMLKNLGRFWRMLKNLLKINLTYLTVSGWENGEYGPVLKGCRGVMWCYDCFGSIDVCFLCSPHCFMASQLAQGPDQIRSSDIIPARCPAIQSRTGSWWTSHIDSEPRGRPSSQHAAWSSSFVLWWPHGCQTMNTIQSSSECMRRR